MLALEKNTHLLELEHIFAAFPLGDTVYDLKAVNPNIQIEQDTRTPAELIALIETQAQEVAKALALLQE
jgi:hypothetical protein